MADRAGKPWDHGEIEAIVKDCIEMLQLEIAGKKFVKVERNRTLLKIRPFSRFDRK